MKLEDVHKIIEGHLEANLEIRIDRDYGFYSDDGIRVELFLSGKKISDSCVTLRELSNR